MKYFRLVLIICFFGSSSLFAQHNEFPSSIEKVTVFSKGAQIERVSQVRLEKGEQQILVKNLPKNLDQSTITVKPVNSVVKSLIYRINYLKDEKVRAKEELMLFNQKDSIENEINTVNVQLDVIDEEVDFIKVNRSIIGKLKGNSLEDIKSINEYYAERILILFQSKNKLKNQISGNKSLLRRIKNQLSYKDNEVKESTGELLMTVKATESMTENLIISYFIEEAGWYPSYDFRVKNVNSPMEATYLANVSQQTGEDWKNVKIVISSANPKESSRAPEMDVWRVDHWMIPPFERSDEEGVVTNGSVTGKVMSNEDGVGLPGVNVIVKGTTIGAITDIDGNYSIQLPSKNAVLQYSFVGMIPTERSVASNSIIDIVLAEDTQQLEEVIVTGYQQKISRSISGSVSSVLFRGNSSLKQSTTVNSNIDIKTKQVDLEFEIEGKQTILSKPEKRALDMLTYQLDATYQYICSPRYNRNVFLFAYIADWEDLNLLSGEVNLFYEGVYKGKTLLDANSSEDTLKISMGTDRLIKVEIEDLSVEEEKHILSRRKKTFEWEIKIRNLKNETINLLIKDQIPVSMNKLVEVELLEMGDGKHEENNGFVQWEIKLESSVKTTRKLSYEIKYSSKVNISLD